MQVDSASFNPWGPCAGVWNSRAIHYLHMNSMWFTLFYLDSAVFSFGMILFTPSQALFFPPSPKRNTQVEACIMESASYPANLLGLSWWAQWVFWALIIAPSPVLLREHLGKDMPGSLYNYFCYRNMIAVPHISREWTSQVLIAHGNDKGGTVDVLWWLLGWDRACRYKWWTLNLIIFNVLIFCSCGIWHWFLILKYCIKINIYLDYCVLHAPYVLHTSCWSECLACLPLFLTPAHSIWWYSSKSFQTTRY